MQMTIDFDQPAPSIKEKGDLGEADFNAWLRSYGVGYMYVDQSPERFSPFFRYYVKRPDFIVPTRGVGTIAVDVKNCGRLRNGNFTFWYKHQLKRAHNFERLFGMSLWYAYRSVEAGKVVWYWISALSVATLLKAGSKDPRFLQIKPSQFARVSTANDFSRLVNQMRRSQGRSISR